MPASSPARWPWSSVSRCRPAVCSARSLGELQRQLARGDEVDADARAEDPLGAGQHGVRRAPPPSTSPSSASAVGPGERREPELARQRRPDRDRRRVGHGVAPGVVVDRRDQHDLGRSRQRCRRAARSPAPCGRPPRARPPERERRRARPAVVRDRDAHAAALRVLGRVERLARHDRRAASRRRAPRRASSAIAIAPCSDVPQPTTVTGRPASCASRTMPASALTPSGGESSSARTTRAAPRPSPR